MGQKFSHFDSEGAPEMVDISQKKASLRRAIARSSIRMKPETLKALLAGESGKGDPFHTARLAGIMAAKKTSDLIPLCHPIGLDSTQIRLDSDEAKGLVTIEAECLTHATTGVEMEALVAATVTALTFYDMCKALERGIILGETRLILKEGGRTGRFVAS